MWNQFLLVAIGGAAGSLCRYSLSGVAHRFFGNGFAWGTLVVNVLGSFILGFAFAMVDQRQWMAATVRLLLMVGFLGAFTTFSTYALESMNFARQGQLTVAVANIAANNLSGLIAVIAGFWAARFL